MKNLTLLTTITAAAITIITPHTAAAQTKNKLYKCPLPYGRVVFQQLPCELNEESKAITKEKETNQPKTQETKPAETKAPQTQKQNQTK